MAVAVDEVQEEGRESVSVAQRAAGASAHSLRYNRALRAAICATNS